MDITSPQTDEGVFRRPQYYSISLLYIQENKEDLFKMQI